MDLLGTKLKVIFLLRNRNLLKQNLRPILKKNKK